MSLTPYHTYDGPRDNFVTCIGFGIEASRIESAARYIGDFCGRIGSAESKSNRDAGSWYGSWARESQKKGEKKRRSNVGFATTDAQDVQLIHRHQPTPHAATWSTLYSRGVASRARRHDCIRVLWAQSGCRPTRGNPNVGDCPLRPISNQSRQCWSTTDGVRARSRFSKISLFLVRRLEPQRTPPPAPGPVTHPCRPVRCPIQKPQR